jgi:hypothetical protein
MRGLIVSKSDKLNSQERELDEKHHHPKVKLTNSSRLQCSDPFLDERKMLKDSGSEIEVNR